MNDATITPIRGRAPSFESPLESPPEGNRSFIRDAWVELRNAGIEPLNVSEFGGSDADRDEWLDGAELLRLVGERRLSSSKLPSQMLKQHDMLAAGKGINAVLQSRRTSKSTGLIAEGLGRAQNRDDYRVAILTATTGKAGRSRFTKDVVPPLSRMFPDKRTAPFTIVLAAGQEAVRFKGTGGFVQWLSTIDDARGEAFDLVVVDESQDPEPERGKDIVAAVLPTLDTRPGAQIVYAGTAGKYRKGNLLWDHLVMGRRGAAGILEFAMPDTTTAEELASWEPNEAHPEGHVRELVELSHPGIGSLTTIEAIKDRYEALPVETFSMEYGSIFGMGGSSSGIVDAERWDSERITGELPQPPENFSVAIVVHPDQRSAAIVAAWREDDLAHALTLDHRPGVSWLADEAHRIARTYRVPIVHDIQGAVMVEVEHLNRQSPRPQLEPQKFGDIKTAAALLVKEINLGRFRHYDQESMNEAARLAVKRAVGPNAWALGRGDPEDDIIDLEGAAMALHYHDEHANRKRLRVS